MPTKAQFKSSPTAKLLQSHPLDLGEYEKLYKHFHANPELSLHEEKTAATVAKHSCLKAYKVYTSIGGHGLAGVLSNGDGPTVLLRADMDALPVEEKTGLDYASKVITKDDDGNTTPVAHACGHDMHVACLMAAAEWLSSKEVKEQWNGTLVVLFQPNEERGKGASAMVDGGLYDKVPVPDVVLGQHVMPFRTGKVMAKAGTMIAAADSFKITVFGRGGHGSMPQLCIDPVLLAANIVVRLQGIVAREVDPQDAAVVTVGSLQAGHSENVIADQAILKVDIRTQKDETRAKVLKAVKRVVEKVCNVSYAIPVPMLLIFARDYVRKYTKVALMFSGFRFSRLAPHSSQTMGCTCC
jgi:amidohydrolase